MLASVSVVNAQQGNGWGKGGKPSPTPSPVPTPFPAEGSDPDWTGATSTTWSTTTNWSPAATPGPVDVAKFTGTFANQPNLTASASAGGLWMTGTLGQNVTISLSAGTALTLNGTTINSIAGLGILVDNTDARTLTISAPVTLGANQTWTNNSANVVSVTSTTTGLNTNGKALTINGTGDWSIAKIIGSGAITLAGTDTVTFSSTASTYTGQLTVQSGTLSIDNANNSSSNGELGNSAASVILGGSGTTGTLEFTGGDDSSSKKFTMAAGGTGVFQVDTAATTLTLSGAIDGSGDLTKSGAGTLLLSGANTSFSGDVAVDAGTLQMGGATALSSANVVSVAAGATFDINAQNVTIAGLDGGTGTVTNSGGAKTLTLAGTGNYTFAGVITSHNLVDTRLTKSGSGTQILSGTNLYTGITTVSGGTLLVNGSLAATPTTVSNAGTILGGSGTINGTVTVDANAKLQGGDGTLGTTLTLTSALTLNDNSIIQLALGPGGTHSTLARTGSGTWTFDSNQAFTFINLGATPGFYDNIITGVLNPPSEGSWTITNAGFIGTFVWDGVGAGTGNIDLTLTAVPEPGTWIAGGLAFAALLISQRRRLKKLAASS